MLKVLSPWDEFLRKKPGMREQQYPKDVLPMADESEFIDIDDLIQSLPWRERVRIWFLGFKIRYIFWRMRREKAKAVNKNAP